MDKPIFLGFAVLELSKLPMYETYYDILQHYLGEKTLHLHYMDNFILRVNTKDLIKGLKDFSDFSNLNKNHGLFSNRNEKDIGKFKLETPKSVWIDEFVCVSGKMYSFKCGNDNKNKLKDVFKSQSKHNKIEHYYNCLFGGEYQKECDNYNIRSINHEMYLQQVKNQHYLFSMIKDVTKMNLKVYHGIDHVCYLINRCRSKRQI